MAEQGVGGSYETLRQRADKFGYVYAKHLRAGSERRSNIWQLG